MSKTKRAQRECPYCKRKIKRYRTIIEIGEQVCYICWQQTKTMMPVSYIRKEWLK